MFLLLLGYIVAKAYASPGNLTWFTRLFLLVRGWCLGTRLVKHLMKTSGDLGGTCRCDRVAKRRAIEVVPDCPITHHKDTAVLKQGLHIKVHSSGQLQELSPHVHPPTTTSPWLHNVCVLETLYSGYCVYTICYHGSSKGQAHTACLRFRVQVSSWIKLISQKLTCITFPTKKLLYIYNNQSLERVFSLTLSPLQYTVEWQ